MFAWLYRYILRGLGIVVAIGMITILWLAISSRQERKQAPPVPAHGARR